MALIEFAEQPHGNPLEVVERVAATNGWCDLLHRSNCPALQETDMARVVHVRRVGTGAVNFRK